jgi:hypothetical protein
MHCPNCGIESDLDQKFCRKCGFNLAPISKLMLVPGGDDDETKLDKVERDKLLMRRMVSWMMRGMLIMLIGIIVIVVNKQLKLDQLVGLLGTLITLGGVAVVMYGLLDTMRGGGLKKRKPKAMEASSPEEIEPASTTKELEGRLPVPLGSVTERTTQLIKIDRDQSS